MSEEDKKPTTRFGSIANQYATIGGNEREHTSRHEPHEQSAPKHHDVKTLRRQDAEESTEMKRQTVYMPKDLAIWLKAYAATTEDDISGIINHLVENFRNQVEHK